MQETAALMAELSTTLNCPGRLQVGIKSPEVFPSVFKNHEEENDSWILCLIQMTKVSIKSEAPCPEGSSMSSGVGTAAKDGLPRLQVQNAMCGSPESLLYLPCVHTQVFYGFLSELLQPYFL